MNHTLEQTFVLGGVVFHDTDRESLLSYMNDEIRESLNHISFASQQTYFEAYISIAWLIDRDFINVLVQEFDVDVELPKFEKIEEVFHYLKIVQQVSKGVHEIQFIQSDEALQGNQEKVRLVADEDNEFDHTKPYIFVELENGVGVLQYPHFYDVRAFYRCFL